MEKCPFEFNFDPATFKTGDVISYRVPEQFGDMPFVGRVLAVHDDWIEICHDEPGGPGRAMRATRESRPVVSAAEALAD